MLIDRDVAELNERLGWNEFAFMLYCVVAVCTALFSWMIVFDDSPAELPQWPLVIILITVLIAIVQNVIHTCCQCIAIHVAIELASHHSAQKKKE